MRGLIQRGDALAQQANSSDVDGLRQEGEIDALTAQFKQHSDVLLPLAKQRVLLEVFKQGLTNRRADVQSEFSAEAKSLALRLIMLGIALSGTIAFSGLWRKAIFRYVPDARRRHQFLLIRRMYSGLRLSLLSLLRSLPTWLPGHICRFVDCGHRGRSAECKISRRVFLPYRQVRCAGGRSRANWRGDRRST